MQNKEDKNGGQRGNCTPDTPLESVSYRFQKAHVATQATKSTGCCDTIATPAEPARPCGHWNLKAVRPRHGECLCGSDSMRTSTTHHHSTAYWGTVPQFTPVAKEDKQLRLKMLQNGVINVIAMSHTNTTTLTNPREAVESVWL